LSVKSLTPGEIFCRRAAPSGESRPSAVGGLAQIVLVRRSIFGASLSLGSDRPTRPARVRPPRWAVLASSRSGAGLRRTRRAAPPPRPAGTRGSDLSAERQLQATDLEIRGPLRSSHSSIAANRRTGSHIADQFADVPSSRPLWTPPRAASAPRRTTALRPSTGRARDRSPPDQGRTVSHHSTRLFQTLMPWRPQLPASRPAHATARHSSTCRPVRRSDAQRRRSCDG
jgi:hypothetical protein